MAPEPAKITHPQVGKYFEQFTGTYYKLNAQTAVKYPEDLERTMSLAREKYTVDSNVDDGDAE